MISLGQGYTYTERLKMIAEQVTKKPKKVIKKEEVKEEKTTE